MPKINCLIVDDEPIAREIVKTYCGHLPALHVVACCGNALEAKVVLQQQKIDILFLDINMPLLDGIAFLKTLRTQPQVIFTTAYKEYALDAFDLSACDYLLKPFSLERFIIAVDKAFDRLQKPALYHATESSIKTDGHVFIKADSKIFKLQFDELIFAEAQGNYTRINTVLYTIIPAMTFSSFEELLPKPQFLRIHRSFIINKSKITHIEGNRVFINDHELPIGSNYREAFMKELGI